MTTMTVRLVSAASGHRNRVHREDSGRVRHQQVCGECSLRLGADDIGHGYELDDGRIVQIDPGELPVPEEGVIDVRQFAPQTDIDPISLRRSYYVEPDDLSALIRAAPRGAGTHQTAAVVKFAAGRARAAHPAVAGRGAGAALRVPAPRHRGAHR